MVITMSSQTFLQLFEVIDVVTMCVCDNHTQLVFNVIQLALMIGYYFMNVKSSLYLEAEGEEVFYVMAD